MKKVQDLIIGNVLLDLNEKRLSTEDIDPDSISVGDPGEASLSAGELAIVDPRLELKKAEPTSEVFHIAQYDPNNGFRLSLPIFRDQIRRIHKKPYAAAVKRQQRISPTASMCTAGKKYTVMVTENSEEDFPAHGRRRYSVIATADTVVGLVDQMIAQINKDAGAVVVASKGGSTYLALTAKEVGVNFDAILLDENNQKLVDTTLFAKGSLGAGTNRLVRDLEEIYKGYMGFNNRRHLPDTPHYFINDLVNDNQYVTWTIEHMQPRENNETFNLKEIPVVTTVCVKDQATGDEAFDDEINRILQEYASLTHTHA